MDSAPSKRALAVVKQEPRSVRRAVPARIPIQVQLKDRLLKGHEISLEGFRVDSYLEDLQPGEAVWCTIRLDVAGWLLTIRAQATLAGRNATQQTSSFEILEMDEAERELLRRVLKAYLTGETRSLNELLPAVREQQHPLLAPPQHRPHEGRRLARSLRLATLGFGAAGLAGLLAFSIYERFVIVDASFAAITAPQVVVRAPNSGQLTRHGIKAGDRVERDQLVAEVIDKDLRARLTLARATYDYNQRLVQNLKQRIAAAPDADGGILTSPGNAPYAQGAPVIQEMSLEEARARVEEFEAARDYERARIAALEMQVQGDTIFSPCDCLVRWARAATGDEWLQEGEPILVLVRTGEDDLMVEALVHMSEINRIALHQRAFIRIPNVSDAIPARVHAILLESEEQPRAGFPDWVRQDQSLASVLLVPEGPISSQYVGTPVSVDFSHLPDLVSLAGLDDAAGDSKSRAWRLAKSASAAGDQGTAPLAGASDRSRSGRLQRAGGPPEPSAAADPLWPEPSAAADPLWPEPAAAAAAMPE